MTHSLLKCCRLDLYLRQCCPWFSSTFWFCWLLLSVAMLDMCLSKACLAVYNHLSSTWIQNTTTPSCVYFNFPPFLSISPSFPVSIQALFFFPSHKNHYVPLSLSLLSLPLWVPSASLALSFHCNFILNSSHLALLRVCVYYSFFPSYPLNHHHHWFLAPSTTSTAIIGQGLKYASMCVLQNKTIFMTKH